MKFTANSTRVASTSAAAQAGTPIEVTWSWNLLDGLTSQYLLPQTNPCTV